MSREKGQTFTTLTFNNNFTPRYCEHMSSPPFFMGFELLKVLFSVQCFCGSLFVLFLWVIVLSDLLRITDVLNPFFPLLPRFNPAEPVVEKSVIL